MNNKVATVSALCVYPVKSGAALTLTQARVEPRGLAGDRRWMVVDGDGRFLSGRELPKLVRLRATPQNDGLHLQIPEYASMVVARPSAEAARIAVTVWNDRVDAASVGPEVDAWLSQWLGRSVHLVHMDARTERPYPQGYGRPDDRVSFADAFPLLVISAAALDDLNARLPRPVSMLRFRPNLVIAGTAAHAEDHWRYLRIGDVELEAMKSCVRCAFTTVDPERGEFDPDREPLQTLKSYRRGERGVTFGVNFAPRATGVVRVGDAVEVLA